MAINKLTGAASSAIGTPMPKKQSLVEKAVTGPAATVWRPKPQATTPAPYRPRMMGEPLGGGSNQTYVPKPRAGASVGGAMNAALRNPAPYAPGFYDKQREALEAQMADIDKRIAAATAGAKGQRISYGPGSAGGFRYDNQREIDALMNEHGGLAAQVEAMKTREWENRTREEINAQKDEGLRRELDHLAYLNRNPSEETEAERRGIENELRLKYGDKAHDWIAYAERWQNRYAYDKSMQQAQDYAKEHEVAASIGSVPMSVLGGAGVLSATGQKIGNLLRGSDAPVDFRNSANLPSALSGAIRGTVSGEIADNPNSKWDDVGAFLYGIGMSMADSTIAMGLTALGVPGATAIMGGNAATSSMQEAKARGASDTQAIAMGLVSGAAETLMEKASIDSLFNLDNAEPFIKNTLKQMGVEGTEEGLTNLATTLADGLIMGGKSQMQTEIRSLMEDGMSFEDAKRQAGIDWAKSLAADVAGGALSGGLFSAGQRLVTGGFKKPSETAPQTQETPAQPRQEAPAPIPTQQEQAQPKQPPTVADIMPPPAQETAQRAAEQLMPQPQQEVRQEPVAQQEVGQDTNVPTNKQERTEDYNRQKSEVAEAYEEHMAQEHETVSDTVMEKAFRSTLPEPQKQMLDEYLAERDQKQESVEEAPTPVADGANPSIGAADRGFTGPVGQWVGDATTMIKDTNLPKYDKDGNPISDSAGSIVSSDIPMERKNEVERMAYEGKFSYGPDTNQRQVERVHSEIERDGFDAVFERTAEAINSGRASADITAASWVLAVQAANRGEDAKAAEMFMLIKKNSHNNALALQANAIYNKLSPEGQIVGKQRMVNRLNSELKASGNNKGAIRDASEAEQKTAMENIETARNEALDALSNLGGEDDGGSAPSTFTPGSRVRATDRGNIGTVVADNGDGTIKVQFRSRDGLTAVRDMDASVLEPLDGQADGGRTPRGRNHGEPVENWMKRVGERVAQRIEALSGLSGPGEARPKLLTATIRDDLMKFARTYIPKQAPSTAKRTNIDILRDFLANRAEYLEAWKSAQGNSGDTLPDMTADRLELDNVMTSVIAKEAAAEGIRQRGIDVRTYLGDKTALANEIGTEIANQVGASEADAAQIKEAVGEYLEGRYSGDESASKIISSDVKSSLRDLGVKVSELIRSSEKSKRSVSGAVANFLREKYGITQEAAPQAANIIISDLYQYMDVETQKALDSIFGERQKKKASPRNAYDVYTDLKNLGAFGDERYAVQATERVQTRASSDVRKAMNDLNIKIAEVIRSSPQNKSVVGQKVRAMLMTEYGVSQEDAGRISEMITEQYSEYIKTRSEAALQNMFAERPAGDKPRKNVYDIYAELENLGAFGNTAYNDAATQRVRDTASTDIRRTLREIGVKTADLIRSNRGTKQEVSSQISDMIQKSYNISPEGAKSVADILLDEFSKFVADQSEAALGRMYDGTLSQNMRKPRERKSISKQLRELANMGAFTNNKYRRVAAQKLFGADVELDPDLIREYLQETDESKLADIEDRMYKDIGSQIQATTMDKVNQWRYLSMLGNLKTHGRNLIGNAAFVPLRKTKNQFGALGEAIAQRMGLMDQSERTKAFGFNVTEERRNLVDAAKADYATTKELVLGGEKYDHARDMIESGRKYFDTKFLEWLRKTNTDLLEWEDSLFAQSAYADSFADAAHARGYTAKDIAEGKISEDALNSLREYAIKEAQKATYRDVNALSEIASNIKLDENRAKNPASKLAMRTVNALFVEGNLPFKSTPANVLARAGEYSPLGIVRNVIVDPILVKQGKMGAAEYIDHLSSTFAGSALTAAAYFLTRSGVLKLVGGNPEDEEQSKLEGRQEWSLEVAGKSIPLDWVAPSAMPLFMGVELAESLEELAGKPPDMETIKGFLNALVDPFLEMSMLNGVTELVDTAKHAENVPVALMQQSIVSYFSQMLPTLFGQLERALSPKDAVRQRTFVQDGRFLDKDTQYILGKTLNKVPGLDYSQMPYIDRWGRKEENGNIFERLFDNLLNPANTKDIRETPVDVEIKRLEGEGMDNLTPGESEKSITRINEETGEPEEYLLNAKEYEQYQTQRGQTDYNVREAAMSVPQYKSLDSKTQAKIHDRIADYANQLAKSEFGFKPDKWVTDLEGKSPEEIAEQFVIDYAVNQAKDEAKAAGAEDNYLYHALDSLLEKGALTEEQALERSSEGLRGVMDVLRPAGVSYDDFLDYHLALSGSEKEDVLNDIMQASFSDAQKAALGEALYNANPGWMPVNDKAPMDWLLVLDAPGEMLMDNASDSFKENFGKYVEGRSMPNIGVNEAMDVYKYRRPGNDQSDRKKSEVIAYIEQKYPKAEPRELIALYLCAGYKESTIPDKWIRAAQGR